MKAIIPVGLKPVRSASPVRASVPLTRSEVRDIAYDPSIGPRGYGSQLAGWMPRHLEFNPRLARQQSEAAAVRERAKRSGWEYTDDSY